MGIPVAVDEPADELVQLVGDDAETFVCQPHRRLRDALHEVPRLDVEVVVDMSICLLRHRLPVLKDQRRHVGGRSRRHLSMLHRDVLKVHPPSVYASAVLFLHRLTPEGGHLEASSDLLASVPIDRNVPDEHGMVDRSVVDPQLAAEKSGWRFLSNLEIFRQLENEADVNVVNVNRSR